MQWLVSVVVALAVSRGAADAYACSRATPAAFKPTPLPDDTSPPSSPRVTWSVREPTAWLFGACNTWCTADGRIELVVSATDDRSDQLGYEVTLVGDSPFQLMYLPREAVVAERGRLWLIYRDGGDMLDLDVRAVDQNGNRSGPTRVRIDVPRHVYWGRWIGVVVLVVPVVVLLAKRREGRRRPRTKEIGSL